MKKFTILLVLLFSSVAGAAITEYYVASDAGGGGDGLSEPNAFTWAEMASRMTAGAAAAGDRYNVKAGTYARTTNNDAWSNDGTAASPIVVRGYKTTPGDLDPLGAYDCGRTNGGNLITTNMPLVSYDAGNYSFYGTGAAYLIVQNISFSCSRSGYAVALGAGSQLQRCYVVNASTNAAAIGIFITGYNGGSLDCDVNMSGGSGTDCAIYGGAGNCVIIGCKIINAPNDGIQLGSTSGTVINCDVSRCGNDGLVFASTNAAHLPPIVYGNTFYNNADAYSTAKSDAAYTYSGWFVNNQVTDSSGYAINTAIETGMIIAYNRYRDNVSGIQANASDWSTATNWGAVTTDNGGPETDYTDPNTDLTPIATAPALASGVWGETIGAYQGGYPAADKVLNDAYTNGVSGTYVPVAGMSTAWVGSN